MKKENNFRVISRNDRTTSDFREYASYISEYNTALEEQYFAPQPPSLPPSITVDREYSTSVPTEEKEEPEELQPFETPVNNLNSFLKKSFFFKLQKPDLVS